MTHHPFRALTMLFMMSLLMACQPKSPPSTSSAHPSVSSSSPASRSKPAPSSRISDSDDKILVMGDSLSASYGLRTNEGWVALLGQRLQEQHPTWQVINTSISGETSAGGASRIKQALVQHKPTIVIIELGANDGLRGLPLEQTQANLEHMIELAHQQNIQVVLLGMRIPPNFGKTYTEGFASMYAQLSEKYKLVSVPFFLEPIATQPDMFQIDQLHPTAQAQPLLLEQMWKPLQPLLSEDQ